MKIDFSFLISHNGASSGLLNWKSSLLSIVSFSLGFVDLNPLGVFFPWPLWVSLDSGKCRRTASTDSPGHNAYCLFLMAVIHCGFVGNPTAACRYLTSSGDVFNSQTLWMASSVGGRFDKNSVGGRLTTMVLVFTLWTASTSGIHHNLLSVSRHPRRMASFVTVMMVLLAL